MGLLRWPLQPGGGGPTGPTGQVPGQAGQLAGDEPRRHALLRGTSRLLLQGLQPGGPVPGQMGQTGQAGQPSGGGSQGQLGGLPLWRATRLSDLGRL